MGGDDVRTRSEDPLFPAVARRREGDGRPTIRQKCRINRKRLAEPDLDLRFRSGGDPGDRIRLSVQEFLDSRDRREGRGHRLARKADRSLERALHGGRRQTGPVGEDGPGAKMQAERSPGVLQRPLFPEQRNEGSLRVGRHEGLEDVRDDLVLLGRLVVAGLDRGDRVGHGHDESPAGRDHFFGDLVRRRQPFDLGEVGHRFRGIAAQVRDGRSEREQLREWLGLLERTGGLETALRPSTSFLGATTLPGGLRGEENPGNRLFGLALLFEDPDRGFRFAERAV